jgi:hypothetical protein
MPPGLSKGKGILHSLEVIKRCRQLQPYWAEDEWGETVFLQGRGDAVEAVDVARWGADRIMARFRDQGTKAIMGNAAKS